MYCTGRQRCQMPMPSHHVTRWCCWSFLMMINLYPCCCSLWDALYLLLSIICFSLPELSVRYRDHIFVHLLPYAIPMAQMCLFGSCYSTVALTIERYLTLNITVRFRTISLKFLASRYIAVCVPFFRLRHNIKARLYVLPILVAAPLYNFPRFFEFRAKSRTMYGCEQWVMAPISSSSNSSGNSTEEQGQKNFL